MNQGTTKVVEISKKVQERRLGVIQVLRNARGGGWLYARAL